LFTFTMITLINPGFVTNRRIIKNLLPVVVFSLVYFLSQILFHNEKLLVIADFGEWIQYLTSVIRILFFIFFLGQLGYFSYLYLKEEKKYVKHLEDYFSETLQLRMTWVRYAFLSSLGIGLMALLLQIFPYKQFDLFFSAFISIFYFIFAIKFLNYNKLFAVIEPVLETKPEADMLNIKYKRRQMTWIHYKAAIISQKIYLKEKLTLEETAQFLNIGRTTLSTLINSEEKVNFHTWINQLRIEEAKTLFMEYPSHSIIRIAEMSGYSEHSNFSRQFKLIAGETPTAWRNKQEDYKQA
jgi:AraC-like DNA-binding protein